MLSFYHLNVAHVYKFHILLCTFLICVCMCEMNLSTCCSIKFRYIYTAFIGQPSPVPAKHKNKTKKNNTRTKNSSLSLPIQQAKACICIACQATQDCWKQDVSMLIVWGMWTIVFMLIVCGMWTIVQTLSTTLVVSLEVILTLHVDLIWWWLLLYSAILRSRADSLRSHVILHEWIAFIVRFF